MIKNTVLSLVEAAHPSVHHYIFILLFQVILNYCSYQRACLTVRISRTHSTSNGNIASAAADPSHHCYHMTLQTQQIWLSFEHYCVPYVLCRAYIVRVHLFYIIFIMFFPTMFTVLRYKVSLFLNWYIHSFIHLAI